MKKTLCTMAAVAMMCAMVISGCNSPETQPALDNSVVNPPNPSLTLKGSVQGVVVDVRNNPIIGATVTLQYPGAPPSDNPVVTGAGGQYLFTNVPVSGELIINPGAPQFGNGSPYLITVTMLGYATTYTAVLLDYASLAAQGVVTVVGGQLQAVGNLQSTAITARMPTASAVVQGRMKNSETGQLIPNDTDTLPVLCTLSLPSDAVPNALLIWGGGSGQSVHAFSDNSTLSVALTGMCEWDTVPEATDADPITYTLTRSVAGFVPGGNCDPGDSCNEIEVGYGGGHLYALDASTSDYDPMTPYDMVPHQGPVDYEHPFVTYTTIPVGGEIAYGNRANNLSVTFNEEMDPVSGLAMVEAVSFKNPGPVPVTQSWDADTKILTIDPVDILPEGMNIEISLLNFKDIWQNTYTGVNPNGDDDIFTAQSGTCVGMLHAGVCVTLATSGDPTLMAAVLHEQVLRPADSAVGPFGGPANNIPQANNVNQLDKANARLQICGAVPGVSVCGDVAGETDTVFLSWDAATAVPPAIGGLTRQYEAYAELATGGIIAGLPVRVYQSMKSSNPPTTASVDLSTIDAAELAQALPRVSVLNDGGVLFFDEGFELNVAVIALNSNAMRGPYSNAITVQDNVPPTVADQGCGWDSTVIGAGGALDVCGLAPVNGTLETSLPVYLLDSGWGTTFDVNLQTLAELTGGPGSDTYDAADWTTFIGTGTTIPVVMSEDLDIAQNPLAALQLNSVPGVNITGATIPGTTASRRNINIALQGAMLIQPGNSIAFANGASAIIDEALNAALASNATLVFGDNVVPLFTHVVAQAATANLQRLVATFSEPVSTAAGTGDAEDPTNYTFTGVGPLDVATLVGQTVTIVSYTDFQYGDLHEGYDPGGAALPVPATNELTATVEDLNGNECGNTGAIAPPKVIFLVDDQIAPRILDHGDPLGEGCLDVNNPGSPCNDPANAAALGWIVGYTNPAQTPLSVQVVFSEPVVWDVSGPVGVPDGVINDLDETALVITASVTPVATYITAAAIDAGSGANNNVGLTIFLKAGQTVADGDSLTVHVEDISGNSSNLSGKNVITLDEAAGLPDFYTVH